MTRRSELSLAGVGAGLAYALSAEPFAVPGLVFAGPAIWAWALGDERAAASPRRAFALGGVSGLTMQLVAFAWVPGLLERFAGFPAVAAWATATLLYAAQALPYALALGTAAALRRSGLPLWAALPLTLTVIAGRLPTLFPWRPADILTTAALPYAQLADLGGAPLVDLAFSCLGVCFVESFRSSSRAPRALFAAALVVPTLYGALRLDAVERARGALPAVPVGVIQPNVSIEDKHDPGRAFANLEALHAGTVLAVSEGAALVIWPESAHPFPLPRGHLRDRGDVAAIRPPGIAVPVVTGVVTREDRCVRWNSAVAVEPSGRIAGVADKIALLPFGEVAPLHHLYPAWLEERVPCAGFVRGEREPMLRAAGVEIGVLNCYEDLLPARSRALVHAGAELLVNLTNDAWFGDTAEPHLHHMVSRLRAIETRRDLLRAVNTGVSAHVSSTGRDLVRTETFVETRFVSEARLGGELTPYARLGDRLTPAGLALLFAALVPRRRRAPRLTSR